MNHEVMYLVGPEQVELRSEAIPIPGEGEILLRIEAATTCGTDVKVFRRGGHPRMLRVPTPFGHEMAGVVARVGSGVKSPVEGDRVVVANSAPCGDCDYCRVGRENLCQNLDYLNGAFAGFLLIPRRFVERSTYRLDDRVPPEMAALTEPLACVLHGIDACELSSPRDVLVFGAGPIGLLFVGALSAAGHDVTVADPNPPRLTTARRLGARATFRIERGGAQAARVLESSARPTGFSCVIEATGVPEVWRDAVDCVRPGGLVNLFGGCAPGIEVPIDTHALHYGEVTIKGVYHHRPDSFRRALDLLARGTFDAGTLLSAEMPLGRLEEALRSMMSKEALKVVIRPDSS